MYSVNKTIKRYLLSFPILAGLVGLSFILQATTSATQSKNEECKEDDNRLLASASADKNMSVCSIWDWKTGKYVLICPEDKEVGIWGCSLPKDLSNYNLTHTNLSKGNFTGIKLPKDLSGVNLTYATLARQQFTNNNFAGTKLKGAILDKTICNYQECFQAHVKANKLRGGRWYKDNLTKDLKSIAQVYPQLSQDSHKAELLQIASGLAYLPYWEDVEFYIKIDYWSCKLLILQKKLDSGLGSKLVCSLASNLESEVKTYCWHRAAYNWKKDYYFPDEVEQAEEAPHDDFAEYLQVFQKGLKNCNCQSEDEWGYKWYKYNITKNIQGLQKTYPKLTSEKLRKEAVDIGFQLSKIYQYQHLPFLFRYLFLQNRLIQLKISAGGEAGKKVHYNYIPTDAPDCSWSRGRK